MEDSIFTKIIKGDIPAHKIYEDDKTLAFLTIDPVTDGHTLVVPKQQVDELWKLDDDLYHAVMLTVKKVANRLQEIIKPPRVGMALEGFGVADHAHVHVFPLQKGLEPTFAEHMQSGKSDPDHAALAEMAARLKF